MANEAFSTPYSKAWEAFSQTKDFKRLVEGSNVAPQYAENRLRVAFDAGWNAKTTSSILEALNSASDKVNK